MRIGINSAMVLFYIFTVVAALGFYLYEGGAPSWLPGEIAEVPVPEVSAAVALMLFIGIGASNGTGTVNPLAFFAPFGRMFVGAVSSRRPYTVGHAFMDLARTSVVYPAKGLYYVAAWTLGRGYRVARRAGPAPGGPVVAVADSVGAEQAPSSVPPAVSERDRSPTAPSRHGPRPDGARIQTTKANEKRYLSAEMHAKFPRLKLDPGGAGASIECRTLNEAMALSRSRYQDRIVKVYVASRNGLEGREIGYYRNGDYI